jgi:hypothetical protein
LSCSSTGPAAAAAVDGRSADAEASRPPLSLLDAADTALAAIDASLESMDGGAFGP